MPFRHVAAIAYLGLGDDTGPEVGDQAVDRLGLAEVDQPRLVGIPGPEYERHVARRLPESLTPCVYGLEVTHVESDELDQRDPFGKAQGHSTAVGCAELLLEVHLGDLAG